MSATPGPWTVGEAPDDCVVTAANGRMICECYEDGETQTNEDRANARLVSAAPGLLAALKEARALVDSDYTGRGNRDLSGGLLARIDAEIAKATAP